MGQFAEFRIIDPQPHTAIANRMPEAIDNEHITT